MADGRKNKKRRYREKELIPQRCKKALELRTIHNQRVYAKEEDNNAMERMK
jgi:hypothetical protein